MYLLRVILLCNGKIYIQLCMHMNQWFFAITQFCYVRGLKFLNYLLVTHCTDDDTVKVHLHRQQFYLGCTQQDVVFSRE